MINKSFIAETDKIIARFQERKVSVWNGNLLVAKVKQDKQTAGGIFIPDDANIKDNYHNGLARILAVADNADPQYKPGMYVIHSHESRYKLFEDSVRAVLDHLIEKDLVYAVQDNNVLMTISAEEMQK